jgi:hypothetical protein
MTHNESKEINLKIKRASDNIKELGEKRYDSWMMQI